MTKDQLELSFVGVTPSKTSVTELAGRIIYSIENGDIHAVEAAVILNAIKQTCDEALSGIREFVVDELEKEGGKTSLHGCKIEKAEVGVKYDFSHNVSWVEAKNKEDEAAEKRKELEKILKTIPAGKEIFDGEGNQLIGPARSSITGFKTTLAK